MKGRRGEEEKKGSEVKRKVTQRENHKIWTNLKIRDL
jgi:hypothetical protein